MVLYLSRLSYERTIDSLAMRYKRRYNVNREKGCTFTGGIMQDEIDLHGLIADEALYRLDKYLREAHMMGLLQVRVVHGKGTGTLRQATTEMLKNHPLVESYRLARPEEGGGGATVVELRKY